MVQYVTKQSGSQVGRCVVIIYENPSIRDRAVQFCERLTEERQLPTADMEWWSFPVLSHPKTSGNTVEKAANAEVIIFAMESSGDLPDDIKLWIEKWLNKRGEREGALVGLLNHEEAPHRVATFREIYLRHTARRAGMDYLSHAAPTETRAIPDSIDSFSERADAVTSVLDNILQKPTNAPPLF